MFDTIVEKTDDIPSDRPSASIHICDDFNIHHKELLVHSVRTNKEGRYCQDFSIAYDLTLRVDKPTHVPDLSGHHATLLDLFLLAPTTNAASSDYLLIK